jgi:hypothetical protein
VLAALEKNLKDEKEIKKIQNIFYKVAFMYDPN